MRLLLILLLLATFPLSANAAKDQPNVILIMSDDQGWGDTGYNGHPHLKTPSLDKMSAEGVTFTRWYAAAPVCSPTRGSCLTGRHPARFGVPYANSGHLRKGEITIQRVLKKHGYTTGHFGKWHLGTLTTKLKDSNRGKPGNVSDYAPPWERDFDVCFSTEAKVPTYNPMYRNWDPENPDKISDGDPRYGTRYFDQTGKVVTKNLDGCDSRVIMDRAIPFVEQAVKEKKPFFVVVWFHAPHLPVRAGRKHREPYEKLTGKGLSPDYLGCITALDEQIGRLREKLEELNVDKNTMVWFSSDNGPEGSSKSTGTTNGLRGRKRSLYEGGVRVPGLLVWPAVVKKPIKIDTPACTSDYLPTVLSAVGVFDKEIPKERPIDGINLLPIIQGKQKLRGKPIGFYSKKNVTWNDDQYKIVKSKRSWELYDIVADKGETKDLAAEKPEVVEAMAKRCDAWLKSVQASNKGADYELEKK